jgi:hypothetical protein
VGDGGASGGRRSRISIGWGMEADSAARAAGDRVGGRRGVKGRVTGDEVGRWCEGEQDRRWQRL